VSLLPCGTETQHQTAGSGHEEGLAKTEMAARAAFFPHRTLCGELKPELPK
jgi:hypothetical protein